MLYCSSYEDFVQIVETVKEELEEVDAPISSKRKFLAFLDNDVELKQCCMFGRINSGMPMTNNTCEGPHRIMNKNTRFMRKSDRKLNAIIDTVEDLIKNFDQRNVRSFNDHCKKMREKQKKYHFIENDTEQKFADEVYYSCLYGRDAPGIHTAMKKFRKERVEQELLDYNIITDAMSYLEEFEEEINKSENSTLEVVKLLIAGGFMVERK